MCMCVCVSTTCPKGSFKINMFSKRRISNHLIVKFSLEVARIRLLYFIPSICGESIIIGEVKIETKQFEKGVLDLR